MSRYLIPLGRVLWVLLALNSIFLVGATAWVAFERLTSPSARLSEGLEHLGLSQDFYAAFFVIAPILLWLVFFIVSLLIYLLRPNDDFALLVSIFLLNFGASNAYPQVPEFLQFYQQQPFWYLVPVTIAYLFSYPLFGFFLAGFPDGRFVPRWSRWFALFGFLLALFWSFFPNAFTEANMGLAIFGGVSVTILLTAILYAQVVRYRHYSSPLQRQQTKWFLFAFVVVVVVTALQLLLPLVGRSVTASSAASILNELVNMAATLSIAAVPIAVGFSILRYRLWDIDVLIRRTVTYSLLTAALVGIYFGMVILLQRIVSAFVGEQQNDIITVISTLAIAALFVPLRNWIQNVLDRRFYRRKYDAQQVLNKFGETVRDETDLEKLTSELVNVVQETMQPKSISLWLKAERWDPRR